MRAAPILVILAAALALAACEKEIKAPSAAETCYQALFLSHGGGGFNPLSQHEPTIESCAAALEGMRLRFAAMGGAEEIVGAYQGNYIFLFHEGIFRADTLKGARYPMLVRLGGQLVAPGSVPRSLVDSSGPAQGQ